MILPSVPAVNGDIAEQSPCDVESSPVLGFAVECVQTPGLSLSLSPVRLLYLFTWSSAHLSSVLEFDSVF